jgi:hypothetical protein
LISIDINIFHLLKKGSIVHKNVMMVVLPKEMDSYYNNYLLWKALGNPHIHFNKNVYKNTTRISARAGFGPKHPTFVRTPIYVT